MHIMKNELNDPYYMRKIIFERDRFIFVYSIKMFLNFDHLCLLCFQRIFNCIRYMSKLQNTVERRLTPKFLLLCLIFVVVKFRNASTTIVSRIISNSTTVDTWTSLYASFASLNFEYLSNLCNSTKIKSSKRIFVENTSNTFSKMKRVLHVQAQYA